MVEGDRWKCGGDAVDIGGGCAGVERWDESEDVD